MSTTDTMPTHGNATLDFRLVNVTGTREYAFSVNPSLLVEDVIRNVVEEMQLPDTVVYAFRDDGSSRYLKEGNSIGSEIRPGARLTVTPKTHLG
jgi:hypothetical protein